MARQFRLPYYAPMVGLRPRSPHHGPGRPGHGGDRGRQSRYVQSSHESAQRIIMGEPRVLNTADALSSEQVPSPTISDTPPPPAPAVRPCPSPPKPHPTSPPHPE